MNNTSAVRAVQPRAEFSTRRRALRGLMDIAVRAADEAPNRRSELLLRDAGARIADALAAEREALT